MSKLLRVHIGQDISKEWMLKQIEETLEKKLTLAKKNPTNLIARILIVKQILYASLWYILALWAGDAKDLKCIDKIILYFLCAGQASSTRHRVNRATLLRPKRKGGLGLVDLSGQVVALAAKVILWAITVGDHPL